MSDHLCTVCGAYATRSNDFGKTWVCVEHDPQREKHLARLAEANARHAAATGYACKACDDAGCPHCRPEQFGLPPCKPISTARMGTTQEKSDD
jgi:hypothetical protein